MKKLSLILVLLGLFVIYAVANPYLDNSTENAHQQALVERYEKATGANVIEPGTCATPKDVSGVLRIPSLKLVQPIVDGISDAVLDSGVVGAYPGMPGKGNYSLAGHRVTHGEPFRNLPNLGKGDKVIVENRCESFTFIITDNFEVPMSDTSVLNQTVTPTITLITCADLFHSDIRTVVIGRLAS